MRISLANLRQLVLGSAGVGSLLFGLPAVLADTADSQNEILTASRGYSKVSPSPTPVPIPGRTPSQWKHRPHHSPAPPTGQRMKPVYSVLPPPGTLSKTYQRPSWPVPNDEHPRTAIFEVTASGFTELRMEGLVDMEGFQRPDGTWVFKSKQALTPGIAHIYRVKAGYKNSNNTHWDVRTVRLIPGRVVTLDY